MTPSRYRVSAREVAGRDVATLRILPVDEPVTTPAPGQFNMLWVPGVGEVPISLAGADDDSFVHTIRSVGAVTEALCAMEPGDQLGVRGPFGTGWQLDAAAGRDVLVVAGGLGLVPLRPLIHTLVADRGRFGDVAIVVGARTPGDLLYIDEYAAWGAVADLAVTVDRAPADWTGHVGVVTDVLSAVSVDPADAAVFVCGPEPMMRIVARALLDRGADASDIQVSLERNMHCAIGHCGRCQLGPVLLCREGPVVTWSRVADVLSVPER